MTDVIAKRYSVDKNVVIYYFQRLQFKFVLEFVENKNNNFVFKN